MFFSILINSETLRCAIIVSQCPSVASWIQSILPPFFLSFFSLRICNSDRQRTTRWPSTSFHSLFVRLHFTSARGKNTRTRMSSSSLFLSILCLLFAQSISGAHVDDNRIIIGSSVGGVLGLVSAKFNRYTESIIGIIRSSWFLIWSLFLNYWNRADVAFVRS